MPVHWTYPGLDAAADADERQRIVARMDEFWNQFAASRGEIAGVFERTSDLDLPAWMQRWLVPVSPEIMWEFGPADGGDGHRLVLTSESEHGLRPLVDALVRRAPILAGWEFYGWRRREDWRATLFEVESRAGVSLDAATFRATPGHHGLLDVEVAAPVFSTMDEREAFGVAVLLIEKLVGEKDLNVWVGGIGTEPTEPRSRSVLHAASRWALRGTTDEADGWQDMAALPAILDAHKKARRETLEARSFADVVQADDWAMWELEPTPRSGYPRQLDLFVGKSGLREIWQGAHGSRFFAERFVANGETLAYVKLDGREDVDEEAFEDKWSIEDALDSALRRENLGAFVGGGTGLHHSYIDVALKDVVAGVQVIKDVLTGGNVTRRSWVLFEDAHLEREWVPLYPDSPPPPTDDDDADTTAAPPPGLTIVDPD
jgi:hypothetical protein